MNTIVISDMHWPYAHRDTIPFLRAVKDHYGITDAKCVGDECDFHALSFHGSDPDLYSAGDELKEARKGIRQVEELFPKLDLVDSNHGSLVYRRAKHHGLSREVIRPYAEVLGVGAGWQWHYDLTFRLPNGQHVYMHHGKHSNVVKLSQSMGMSAVQGHHHSLFGIGYWGNPNALFWGMQVGCLIDDDALAFAYNKTTLHRPVIGCGVIIDSQPKLVPLIKKKSGRWNGKVV